MSKMTNNDFIHRGIIKINAIILSHKSHKNTENLEDKNAELNEYEFRYLEECKDRKNKFINLISSEYPEFTSFGEDLANYLLVFGDNYIEELKANGKFYNLLKEIVQLIQENRIER